MVALFESLRVEEYGNAVLVYNSKLHSQRIFKSSRELGFQECHIVPKGRERQDDLFLQNQIKNYLQFNLNKVVSFKENTVVDPYKEGPTHRVYKLRFIYNENGAININHEEYKRDLNTDWKVRVIPQDEFHIKTQEEAWKHKLYNRENIPVSKDWQEQIWTNEKGEICEGSFTNIFWQDENEQWYTPSLKTNILPGIMRSLLIPMLEAKEVEYTVHDLKQAKFVYLANAMIGLKLISIAEFG